MSNITCSKIDLIDFTWAVAQAALIGNDFMSEIMSTQLLTYDALSHACILAGLKVGVFIVLLPLGIYAVIAGFRAFCGMISTSAKA